MSSDEKTEVEKLARLVRMILLTFIWMFVIAMVGAFFFGFSVPVTSQ
jgi:flagellar basal body-associated protein FliL